MKPILIWHSRHDMLPSVADALRAYRIIQIDSHETLNVANVWGRVFTDVCAFPDVILTTWGRGALDRLVYSTTLPGFRRRDGTACVIVKTVMMPLRPDAWSGKFREFYYDGGRGRVDFEEWKPVGEREAA